MVKFLSSGVTATMLFSGSRAQLSESAAKRLHYSDDWDDALQYMHQKHLSESAAKRLHYSDDWDDALQYMHKEHLSESSAKRIPAWGWPDALQYMHEKHGEQLSESAAKRVPIDGWPDALQYMHEGHEEKQESSPLPSPEGHWTPHATVRFFARYEDRISMVAAMQQLAHDKNSSIVYTDLHVFGKQIKKYLVEEVVPNDDVYASCHDPQDCIHSDSDQVCDSRFNKPIAWKPKVTPSHPKPVCHSPPTDTTMVYALTQFEDGTANWIMWACHTMDSENMCHVTDMFVANTALLRSIELKSTVV